MGELFDGGSALVQVFPLWLGTWASQTPRTSSEPVIMPPLPQPQHKHTLKLSHRLKHMFVDVRHDWTPLLRTSLAAFIRPYQRENLVAPVGSENDPELLFGKKTSNHKFCYETSENQTFSCMYKHSRQDESTLYESFRWLIPYKRKTVVSWTSLNFGGFCSKIRRYKVFIGRYWDTKIYM